MATLMRWEPFRELTTMRNMMDRLVDDSYRDSPEVWSHGDVTFPLALDVSEDEDAYLVEASVPGLDPDDLDITLTDNTLTVSGKIEQEEEKEGKRYHLRERRVGSFSRSLTMPTSVDPEKIEATHENGVLTLRLPKVEAVKPKKIAVKKMIETS